MNQILETTSIRKIFPVMTCYIILLSKLNFFHQKINTITKDDFSIENLIEKLIS